ncbi:hypothetical protein DPMN_191639 [Dreissena polymorpha]|uniref:Uncharacterized protein n=1 Tax=Dreissena polymorpha TaxID=45954 RepID=A0A9D4BF01_DREPO|nr:hypothetical protein DPMN_191639 [Dreissena polymorpha]
MPNEKNFAAGVLVFLVDLHQSFLIVQFFQHPPYVIMPYATKTEGEMRRSKRVRQSSKRMLLYSQDTDSDSSLQKVIHQINENLRK